MWTLAETQRRGKGVISVDESCSSGLGCRYCD